MALISSAKVEHSTKVFLSALVKGFILPKISNILGKYFLFSNSNSAILLTIKCPVFPQAYKDPKNNK